MGPNLDLDVVGMGASRKGNSGPYLRGMLALSGIEKAYPLAGGSLPVLKGIDLNIEQGEMVAIMGSSGSGKSTLLNVLGLLDGFDSGGYDLDGVNMAGLSEKQAARYRSQFLGFVFQSFNLISFKTALENVALPLFYQKVPRRERQRRAMEMLGKMGMDDRADHLPSELSGGQKQRIGIARALYRNCSVLVFDEATSSLDNETEAEIVASIKNLKRDKTIIVIAHRLSTIEHCDKVIEMKNGQIVKCTSSIDAK